MPSKHGLNWKELV